MGSGDVVLAYGVEVVGTRATLSPSKEVFVLEGAKGPGEETCQARLSAVPAEALAPSAATCSRRAELWFSAP